MVRDEKLSLGRRGKGTGWLLAIPPAPALLGWRAGMLPGHGGMHKRWWAEGSELLVRANEMDIPFLDARDEKNTDAPEHLCRKPITFLLGCG